LIDDIAPLIFLNHQDTVTANVFSIIHEFVHVLVGTPEVLNESPTVQSSKQEERWINAVTAAVLMPEKTILREYRAGNSNISHLARYFHVSPAAMAIRLHELNLINQDLVDEQMTTEIEPPVKPTGGDYYRNQISRLDTAYLYAVIDAQRSGVISTSEATSLSSTSMKTFDEVANRFMESVA
jgi:Zn-dependent peptidase ImmA (M78 family)